MTEHTGLRSKLNAEWRQFSVYNLIWIWFFLLFLEGALRKWVVPQLSTPLLIVRDPVMLMTYVLALRAGLFPLNRLTISLILLGMASFVAGLAADGNTLVVAAYGFRTNFLYWPFIFIIAHTFNKENVLNMGKMCLMIVLPMALLMTVQHNSPPDHWLNTGAGQDVQQLRGTVGNIRPPGTFSFITGIAEYFAVTTAFFVYWFFDRKAYPWWLIVLAGGGLFVGGFVSISRLTLTGVLIVIGTGALLGLLNKRVFWTFGIFGLFGIAMFFLLMQVDVVSRAMETFFERVEHAGMSEGGWAGYLERITREFTLPLFITDKVPVLGEGLGVGTSVGSKLLTGARGYALAEGELARNVMEGGPILGWLFVAWRFVLGIYMVIISYRSLLLGNYLPMLLCSSALMLVIIGQIGRPTTLGFTLLTAGLCLAAARTDSSEPPLGRHAFKTNRTFG